MAGRKNDHSRARSAAAHEAFIEKVETLGGVVLEPEWLGAITPHRILCAAGHETEMAPNNVMRRGRICKVCAGQCSDTAWRNFRARVEDLGGEVLEPRWKKALVPHRVRCMQGHEVSVMPAHIQQGTGLCHRCAGMNWDVFYVTQSPDTSEIKFGISSGDPRPRLTTHRRDGYSDVLRLFIKLPGNSALETEREVLQALCDEGFKPVRGREYFAAPALNPVLELVDSLLDSN